MSVANPEMRSVEHELQAVYNYCPPTQTHYRSEEARLEYQRFWGTFLASMGLPPSAFHGARVLDVGCGSCEKAGFYHDWGGQVTGLDLTEEVLRVGRRNLADRAVELVHGSIFDFERYGQYDIVLIDGVSFITADTRAALAAAAAQLKPGGVLLFSVTNVWGSFWWFAPARRVVTWLGRSDFHRRARWGRRLCRWLRTSQEGTDKDSPFYRSEDSWAYDWFGPPAYHLHSPTELASWLPALSLRHLGSVPGLVLKDAPLTLGARVVRAVTGGGSRGMSWFWLSNRAANMAYVAAVKESRTSPP